MRPHLVLGDWNAICQQCGRQFKASELKKRPRDNLMVCKDDWETRHPQEFVKAVPDSGKVPWTSPNVDLDSDGNPRVQGGPTYISHSIGVQPVDPRTQ